MTPADDLHAQAMPQRAEPMRAPPTYDTLDVSIRADRVWVVTLGKSDATTHNTLGAKLAGELFAALQAAEHDPSARAIVIRSAKASFLVGADLAYLKTLRYAKDAEDFALSLAERFATLAKRTKPVVACVHGAALGTGFELALACSGTIATDDPSTVFGFPEAKVGLLPAANGLLRVAERAGLEQAIELGLNSRNLKPAQALLLGLVDEVVSVDYALDAACRFALRLVTRPGMRRALPGRRAWMRHRGEPLAQVRDATPRLLLEQNPVGRALLFRRARAENAERTRGHYPATERMLDVLQRFGSRGFASAAKLEAQLFGELLVSETSHRLVELFFALAASRKDRGIEPGERTSAPPAPVERIAVVGAGLMGAGIAYASAQAGIAVHLTDKDAGALARGVDYIRTVLDERVRRGSITRAERDHALGCLDSATDDAALGDADLVIEAVFEDRALKHDVLSALEKRVKDACVIASNTSSLPIAQIAAASARPERILGMHYSSPVHRTQLLEVVRTKDTAPMAITSALGVGRRQGKHVIVVHDGTGFYTTRILMPFLREAILMLGEGLAIETIDQALVDWGFPTGPLHLLDETGIDLAAHVFNVLEDAFGERMRPPAALLTLRADDRRGKKNGRGFYLHGRGQKGHRRVDDTVYEALGVRPTTSKIMADDISLRSAMALVNEAIRCLDEGILRSARDGDVGAVFGVGFPAFRGGPFRYVDVLGAPEVLRRTRSLEQRFGARFEPAPRLVEMARSGQRFFD